MGWNWSLPVHVIPCALKPMLYVLGSFKAICNMVIGNLKGTKQKKVNKLNQHQMHPTAPKAKNYGHNQYQA